MTESSSRNNVVVKIFGEDYPITGSADPANISRVADTVDSRMREIAGQGRIQARDKVAILAALSFASELTEYSDRSSQGGQALETRLTNLASRLDSALAR